MFNQKIEQAFLIATKPISEHKQLVTFISKELGRFSSVVSSKKRPLIGSFASVRVQSRLPEQLGFCVIEYGTNCCLKILNDAVKSRILFTLCGMLNTVLPEKQPFPELTDFVFDFLLHLEKKELSDYIRLEIFLLNALGFGLDFSKCAGGGDKNNLYYVSPNTGRAVSLEKGKPYHNKLLRLPAFLWKNTPPTQEELHLGLILTGYFFKKCVFEKELPTFRVELESYIL